MHLIASLFMFLALAQGPTTSETPDGLQASHKEVAVESVTADASIEQRLRQILDTTERFDGLELEVRNGVALLSGVVDDEGERAWVIDLVSNTQGVVAVSNRIALVESPIWDLTPAFDELLGLWQHFIASLPRVLAGLLVLLVVVLIAGRAARLISSPLAKRFESELLQTVVSKFVLIMVWLFGAYLFLRISGLTQIAMTVVGGTGVLGIVLGFAFRDIAENFLASLLISLQRPFRIGDTIQVEDNIGVVQRVTPRGTILMDFEGNYIQIANAKVYKSTIKNFTANPNVRQDFLIGIGYDAGVTHAQEVVMGVLNGHSAVLQDPRPMVLVEQLASSTINLRVYFWVNGAQHSKAKVRSALMRMALRALEEENVSMPDDAREIIFPAGVPVRMLDQPTGAPSKPPAPVQSQAEEEMREEDRHDEATSAEGNLESETAELNEQARRSRSPEEGADILER